MKKRRIFQAPEQGDITSLMDIVTIIVVFLLTGYTASDLVIPIVKNVEIPFSLSEQMGREEILVQVSSNREVYLKDQLIGTFDDDNTMVVQVLFDKLSEEKKKLEQKYNDLLAKNNQKIDLLTLGFVGEEIYQQVNIVFDKNVPYKNMKKIFITAAAAGFPKYRLIIKNEV
jgi:biopolymer transport protein ExbD